MIYHVPVLYEEVKELICIKKEGVYVDCTLGTGGHAELLLKEIPKAEIIGIDRDEKAVEIAKERFSTFQNRVKFIHGNFDSLKELVPNYTNKIDGIIFDLGLSSYQLSDSNRGFSFQTNGPLDMRMDKNEHITASAILNKSSEETLRKIFSEYGEERYTGRIASRIVEERKTTPITTTFQLVELIKKAIPYKAHYGRIHPATRVFQALRIAVNKELECLKAGLTSAIEMLKSGGRVLVISFHSLEDRIVKNTFHMLAKSNVVNIITKKPIIPSLAEIHINPRARSAKLRAAEKI